MILLVPFVMRMNLLITCFLVALLQGMFGNYLLCGIEIINSVIDMACVASI